MRKYISSCIITLLSLFSVSIYADEWLDVAEDIQQHIGTDIITSEIQTKIDQKLTKIYECLETDDPCMYLAEKQSLKVSFAGLEDIARYYKAKGHQNAVLDSIIQEDSSIKAMTQDEILPMGAVVTDILLAHYYSYEKTQYERLLGRDREEARKKNETALKYVPEGVIIPSVPSSSTSQAIVVDISDQRLFAFEKDVLVYTTPITSGKNGYGTVQGDFSVKRKLQNRVLTSPFKNQKYRLYVDYWIEFFPKYGIHDACNSKNCWRKEFGGPDYKTRGSHGCVNTPYDAVKWLYDWSLEGTAVRVQK